MRKVILFIILAASIQPVQARTTVSGEIARIYPNGNHIHFRLKNDNCVDSSEYYYFSLTDSSGNPSEVAKAWYSLLLSAAVAGKKINVSVAECVGGTKIPVRYIYQDF